MTVPTRHGASDAAVIERSWREPGVFAALYERHAAHISRYVARRLGDDLADDVTAETFYRAFEKRRPGPGVGHLRGNGAVTAAPRSAEDPCRARRREPHVRYRGKLRCRP
ncbi:hypothetical protein GCM10023191_085200 [Actinoallomurus oryzae]|uniref:RNA polymerase sigma-70 region 2 domain-containing protein n=1 Tax=Actinoallomurus oryzae TaxID=502180 RepID=A0ABP8R1E9_9ACTN